MSIFFHEQLYRTPEIMTKLKNLSITICGAGALGANITENLARSGFTKLWLIDYDSIEERNLSTQPYYLSEIEVFKVKIFSNNLYRAIGIKIDSKYQKLTEKNANNLL